MSGLVKSSLTSSESPPGDAWTAAASLIRGWLQNRERIDRLMEALPASLAGPARARCQHLVFGVVRHAGRLDTALNRLIAHPPRAGTRALLLVAGYELIEARGDAEVGRTAKIVHHAVDRARALASPAEARLANAVLRKLAGILEAEHPPGEGVTPEALAEYFSHPEWLVRRWLDRFGAGATRALLDWNQRPSPVYARMRDGGGKTGGEADPRPDWLKPTSWPGFFEVPSGRWGEIELLLTAGRLYLQDPSAARAVALLAPQAGEDMLDACAAPGGKSLLTADTMGTGRLVALDLPGVRLGRLRENLARVRGVTVELVPADLREGVERVLRDRGLPVEYPAVLIDVPCTNTGVMRRRPDVKWRLQEGDFQQHAGQQLALLRAAARLVAPGGRLVYSTCSVDPEENEEVIKAFLAEAAGRFALEAQELSKPWEAGHDGAGAFRLRRI